MASRSLAFRKLRRRGVPDFMGRACVLVRPRINRRAVLKRMNLGGDMVGGPPIVLQTQQGDQWCWAAVVQAMLAQAGIQTSQQDIVNKHTGKQCPIAKGSDFRAGYCTKSTGCHLPCNHQHSFLVASQEWGYRFEKIEALGHQATLLEITSALTNGPVAVRAGFVTNMDFGHIIIVTACIEIDGNYTVQYLSTFYLEGSPSVVKLEEVSWTKFLQGFYIRQGKVKMSALYRRL